MHTTKITRRHFLAGSAATLASISGVGRKGVSAASEDRTSEPFRLNYILASPMYGTAPLAEILPEVAKVGAQSIDIWPRGHANQREQVDEMGHEAFAALLDEHGVRLGISTRYDLGPFKLADEIKFVHKFGGKLIVTGAKNAPGDTLRTRVKAFVELLKPHVAIAEEHGVAIGIENHANSLIHSPDSIRYFAEFAKNKHLGIALAPYHLPQDPAVIAELIETLGESLVHFQGWQHGDGCMKKLPKEQEMLQMPGRGPLDFTPLLAALKKIDYSHFTEIFMHPVPRGIPILDTTEQVTAAINESRAYLAACLEKAR